jgi:hypothetical protein
MVFTGSVNRTAETRPRNRGADQRRPVDRAVQLPQILLQAVLLNATKSAATLNRPNVALALETSRSRAGIR